MVVKIQHDVVDVVFHVFIIKRKKITMYIWIDSVSQESITI